LHQQQGRIVVVPKQDDFSEQIETTIVTYTVTTTNRSFEIFYDRRSIKSL
jgi:hypothetical protein